MPQFEIHAKWKRGLGKTKTRRTSRKEMRKRERREGRNRHRRMSKWRRRRSVIRRIGGVRRGVKGVGVGGVC